MTDSLFRPGFLLLLALVFPIACALHKEDISLIDESVDDSVRDGVVSEDLIKFPNGRLVVAMVPSPWSCLAEMTWKNRLLA